MPGLVTDDDRPPGTNGAAANGKGLLEADDEGIGGENGWPGCWLEVIRLAFEGAGEIEGNALGSSS